MNPGITLTVEEIRTLSMFCGFVLHPPTTEEKEDERETEITIQPWPKKGIKDGNEMVTPHKHVAYYDEYPEEGCVPLGSPISTNEPTQPTPQPPPPA